ncbi:MAG TPA: PGPGW domain-containing protein [Actinomycetota bacterium]|nr:PGPGW domain-containing protein [Actinomycetota bacterium]
MRRDDRTQQIPTHRTQELPRTIAVKQTRRVGVAILGGALIALGVILIPLPGPFSIPPIFIGLTVLGWEFRWAKRLQIKVRTKVKQLRKPRT